MLHRVYGNINLPLVAPVTPVLLVCVVCVCVVCASTNRCCGVEKNRSAPTAVENRGVDFRWFAHRTSIETLRQRVGPCSIIAIAFPFTRVFGSTADIANGSARLLGVYWYAGDAVGVGYAAEESAAQLFRPVSRRDQTDATRAAVLDVDKLGGKSITPVGAHALPIATTKNQSDRSASAASPRLTALGFGACRCCTTRSLSTRRSPH